MSWSRQFVFQTGGGRDAGEGKNDDSRGDAVVQPAFHVEGLADSTRYPPVSHDCGTEGRVRRGQRGTHHEGAPRIHRLRRAGSPAPLAQLARLGPV
jgi:hypothetical protein